MADRRFNVESLRVGEFSALKVSGLKRKATVGAVLLHGYGCRKEDMLFLAMNLSGIDSLLIDLPGHGENKNLFCQRNTESLIKELDTLPGAGVKILIGHSVGGFIGMQSKIPFFIGISVPRENNFGGSKQEMLRTLRFRRVKEDFPFAGLNEILSAKKLLRTEGCAYIYAKNDLPSVLSEIKKVSKSGIDVYKIEDSSHIDIVSSSKTAIKICQIFEKTLL